MVTVLDRGVVDVDRMLRDGHVDVRGALGHRRVEILDRSLGGSCTRREVSGHDLSARMAPNSPGGSPERVANQRRERQRTPVRQGECYAIRGWTSAAAIPCFEAVVVVDPVNAVRGDRKCGGGRRVPHGEGSIGVPTLRLPPIEVVEILVDPEMADQRVVCIDVDLCSSRLE